MMNYIRRTFSWKGFAGRREFLGYYFLIFGIFSIGVVLPMFIMSLMELNVDVGFKLWGLVVTLMMAVISLLLWVRRLRYLGWPIWISFLQLIPVLNGVVFVMGSLLLLICSGKNQQEESPNYMKFNLFVGIGGILLPIILLMGLVFMVKNHPEQARRLLLKKQGAVSQVESQNMRKYPNQITEDGFNQSGTSFNRTESTSESLPSIY